MRKAIVIPVVALMLIATGVSAKEGFQVTPIKSVPRSLASMDLLAPGDLCDVGVTDAVFALKRSWRRTFLEGLANRPLRARKLWLLTWVDSRPSTFSMMERMNSGRSPTSTTRSRPAATRSSRIVKPFPTTRDGLRRRPGVASGGLLHLGINI